MLGGYRPKPRQDSYALACILFELLTGDPPYSPALATNRAKDLLPRPPKAIKPEHWEILQQGLAYEEAQRIESAWALHEGLSQAKAVQLPPIQNIHGWSTEGNWGKVQQLQKQTAQALGKPVVFHDTLKDGSPGPELVIIPAGKFLMGSPEDEPGRFSDERQHPVTIAQPFALGKYPVTFEEYDRFAKATGRKLPDDRGWGRGKRPVIDVSWEDVLAYTEWLSEETGQAYHLPTEAQWEYAARGGTATPFYTGNCISTDQANYDGNWGYGNCGNETKTGIWLGKTTEVGHYPANPFGLHDMAGNVWEWTGSLYDEDYQGQEQKTSKKDASGRRVLRGGSWSSFPGDLRAANRGWYDPGFRGSNVGFRVARSAPL